MIRSAPGLRLSGSGLLLLLSLAPAPLRAEVRAEAAAPVQDCPAREAQPGLNSSETAAQIRAAIAQSWNPGPLTPEMAGASLTLRLCPGKDETKPLDLFIIGYEGPEGQAQEAIIGSMMQAIRRLASRGPGLRDALLSLGGGKAEEVTLDLRFELPALPQGAAP